MTDIQIEELFYSVTAIRIDDYLIDAWFEAETGEKHIDVVDEKTHRETSFIANGLSCDELKAKLLEILSR